MITNITNSVCSSKTDEKMKHLRQASEADRPMTTLEYLASIGHFLHVTIISHILYLFGLWGRVSRWRSHTHTHTNPRSNKKIPRWDTLDIILKDMLVAK